MQYIKRRFRQATSTSSGKLIVFSLLALVLSAITGGLLYWQTHKKQIIREQLESAIHLKSDGLYNLHYDSLDLDEISGYLSIKQLKIQYDSLRYRSLSKTDAPSILVNITIPEITVTAVKTPRALIDKEIKGRKLEIKNPELTIFYTMAGKDSSRNVPDREIYEQVLGNLQLINIDTVSITDAQIRTINMKTNTVGMRLTNTSLQLIDVRIDSTGNADTSRVLFAKSITAASESGFWPAASNLYDYQLKGIYLNSATHLLTLKSFVLAPRLGENAFAKSLPTQNDRLDFFFHDIVAKKLDFRQLLNERVIAGEVIIGSSSFKIYRDLNRPRDRKSRVGSFPHQALQKLPVQLGIERIILNNSFVQYREKNTITKQAGTVQFYTINGTLDNMTNIKEMIAANNKMLLNVNCRFMNKAPFSVSWLFYLGSDEGRFHIEGKLGTLQAPDISKLTEPMGPARIKEGIIHSLYFDLTGNNYHMNGTVKLLYEKLKVALLEKDKGEKQLDKKGFTSLMANLLIKDDNPTGSMEPRVATIDYTRDPNRSIFNMTWKALFQGLQQSVGINK